MIIEATPLTVRYPGTEHPALAAVPLALAAGELVAVVGPNGSGKTTLLRALVQLTEVEQGSVTIEGRPLAAWLPRELARRIAVVSQREEAVFPLRVRETVALGRYAHLGPVSAAGTSDETAITEAMQRADVLSLADRRTDTLSGGEWQRVRIARALAQQPRALLLDEPTASLDIRHEMEVLELARRLCTEGLGVLLVTHHLNLAARYADRLLLLHRGAIAAQGRPADVLRSDVLSPVFEWPVAIASWDGVPQIVPLRPAT
jgi:iron complex transport system ATP-binding protein